VSLQVQFLTLGLMLLSGLGLGAAYDGYRVVSHRLGFSRLWLPVLDLLYWAAATLAVFQVLAEANEGEVRLFVFIGLLLGVSCYFWLFSRAVVALVEWLIAAAQTVIRLLYRVFDLAIVRPALLLYRLGRLFLGFLLVLSMFLIRFVLQLIRPFWLLLRWLSAPAARRIASWAAASTAVRRARAIMRRTAAAVAERWTKWF